MTARTAQTPTTTDVPTVTARAGVSARLPILPALRRRWPAALGLGAAALLVASGAVDRELVTTSVSIAALCYLGAAALGRPWVAWAGIAGGGAVVLASELVGLPWWAGLGAASVAVAAAGLARRAPRSHLVAQTAAVAGYGGLAVTAGLLAPRAGLVLAGLTLAGHAVWDVIHHRRNEVVSRNLSEFCMFFDLPLGAAALLLALA